MPPPAPCPAGSLIEGEALCQDNYVDHYNGGCNSTPVIWQSLAPQGGGCAVMCGRSCTYLLYGGSNRDTDWFLSAGAGAVTQTLTADFPFMMALFTGTDCCGLVYTYDLGGAGETRTLTGTVTAGAEVGFFAANSGFSGYPVESTYVMSVCGIENPPSPPGACCNAAGMCIVVAPELCDSLGGTFQGDPTCEPKTCTPVATESVSWGAIKARYLQPDAQPVGAAGRSVSRAPARVTSKPTASPTGPRHDEAGRRFGPGAAWHNAAAKAGESARGGAKRRGKGFDGVPWNRKRFGTREGNPMKQLLCLLVVLCVRFGCEAGPNQGGVLRCRHSASSFHPI